MILQLSDLHLIIPATATNITNYLFVRQHDNHGLGVLRTWSKTLQCVLRLLESIRMPTLISFTRIVNLACFMVKTVDVLVARKMSRVRMDIRELRIDVGIMSMPICIRTCANLSAFLLFIGIALTVKV